MNKSNEGIFKLTWPNIKSALVYGLLTLFASFALSVIETVREAGTFLGLDWTNIVDSSAVATLPILIVFISLLKNLFTNSQGEFFGVTEVIPDKK